MQLVHWTGAARPLVEVHLDVDGAVVCVTRRDCKGSTSESKLGPTTVNELISRISSSAAKRVRSPDAHSVNGHELL